ncbi:unnamed protein product [Ectocarpus sp. CCAP 1310/34]|nr:unnamed protein product [Ectocarpus sp. CCAP 1310/34]
MQWASGWAWSRPCRTSRSRRMLISVEEKAARSGIWPMKPS